MNEKKILGLPISVLNIKKIDSINNCQILYIPDSMMVEKALSLVKGKPILTLTDVKGTRGACVNFYKNTDSLITMDISRENILKQNLMILQMKSYPHHQVE